MGNGIEGVLRWNEVLYVEFAVLLKGAFHYSPTDQVVPPNSFECQFSRALEILKMFQDLFLAHPSLERGNLGTFANHVDVPDGLIGLAVVVQAFGVHQQDVCVAQDGDVEGTVVPV